MPGSSLNHTCTLAHKKLYSMWQKSLSRPRESRKTASLTPTTLAAGKSPVPPTLPQPRCLGQAAGMLVTYIGASLICTFVLHPGTLPCGTWLGCLDPMAFACTPAVAAGGGSLWPQLQQDGCPAASGRCQPSPVARPDQFSCSPDAQGWHAPARGRPSPSCTVLQGHVTHPAAASHCVQHVAQAGAGTILSPWGHGMAAGAELRRSSTAISPGWHAGLLTTGTSPRSCACCPPTSTCPRKKHSKPQQQPPWRRLGQAQTR